MILEDLGIVLKGKHKRHMYKVQCEDCGDTREVRKDASMKPKCHPCSKIGHGKTHGMAKTRPYKIWALMLQRTMNPNNTGYEFYKDKQPPTKWQSFEGFWEDMSDGYSDTLELDRENNNLPYSKNNCRWATRETQVQNTRRLRINNKTGYRGVILRKDTGKYSARICVDNVHTTLGSFQYPWTAAYAYDSYVINNNLEHTRNFTEVAS